LAGEGDIGDFAVLMMPDYRAANPYQELLRRALAAEGCRVEFPTGYRRVFPLYRAARGHPEARLLHLHWTTLYAKSHRPWLHPIYMAKFACDLLLVRLSGRRLVWTLHNLVPHEGRLHRLEMLMQRMLCWLASAVIVHGREGRRVAHRRLGCPGERLHEIPHGHYREAYPPPVGPAEARRRLNLPRAGRVFLFFGMIRPYKGLELLLRAWRRSVPEHATLLIAGACEDAEYTEKLRRLAAGLPSVRLSLERVPDESVPDFFSAADVVVLPFERIQTSGSLILAMSYGKPVVASRLGELPDTIAGADDLLFTAGCEEELADCLREGAAMDAGALTELSARTAACCDRLEWPPIGRATAEVYRTVLGEETGPAKDHRPGACEKEEAQRV